MEIMRMNVAVGMVVVLALALSLRAADDKDELQKLDGTWEIAEVTFKGEKVVDEELKKMQFVFSKDKTAIRKMDGKEVDKSTFEINPAEKPKHIDTKATQGAAKDKVELGMYELDGDTTKRCSAQIDDKKRPATFESTKDSATTLVLLKRVKK